MKEPRRKTGQCNCHIIHDTDDEILTKRLKMIMHVEFTGSGLVWSRRLPLRAMTVTMTATNDCHRDGPIVACIRRVSI